MEKPLSGNFRPDKESVSLAEYERTGGYRGLRKALAMGPAEVTELVKKSNLRGRGGAGFPTGVKWSFVPMGKEAPHPKYLVANADEMEPGTFKDRALMERDPHQLIEGMIVTAYAIEADIGYIFLRGEYECSHDRLSRAIAEAKASNYLGRNILGSSHSFEIHLHVSAGRYMCGEETALLNALEGKRAHPRTKPPFPQVSGLWGKPTIVQNVETLCNIHHIVNHGSDWFRALSRTEDGGTKLFGVSGKVKRPGLWELPMGTPMREILEEHAGGMRDGLRFRGLLPGGASTDFRLWTSGTCKRREAGWAREPWLCWTTVPVPSGWFGISSISLRRNRAAGAHRAGAGWRGRRRFCSQWSKAEGALAISIRSRSKRNSLLPETRSVPSRPGQ